MFGKLFPGQTLLRCLGVPASVRWWTFSLVHAPTCSSFPVFPDDPRGPLINIRTGSDLSALGKPSGSSVPGALLESGTYHESPGLENLELIGVGLFGNYLRKTSFNTSFLQIRDAVEQATARGLVGADSLSRVCVGVEEP